MARIVGIATDPGDHVLDPFLGSATTAAVAHKLGRAWTGIEASAATIERYAEPRLRAVVDGSDRGGISEAAGWEGGGEFAVTSRASEAVAACPAA
jgi:adenine-specific DNA-methyltransferase